MYFDVLGSENNLPLPRIEWDLTSNEGQQLTLGTVVINEKTLSFGFKRLKDVEPGSLGLNDAVYLTAKWPESLFPEGRLELLSRDGKVLWSREIKSSDKEAWRDVVGKSFKGLNSNPLATFDWGGDVEKMSLPLTGLADGFRFCLSRLKENSSERLCSQKYVIRNMGSQTLLGRLKTLGSPRVLINGEASATKGEIETSEDVPTRFFSELASGETLEFTSKPRLVLWSDFVKVEGTNLTRVVGYDMTPVGKFQILNPDKDSNLIQMLGFQSTIEDPRKFWAVTVKEPQAWLYFPGEDGGIFKHPLPLSLAPTSRVRLHLDSRTPTGTYRDGVILKGRKAASSQISSKQKKVNVLDPQNFEWSFQASRDAEINRSSILLVDGGKNFSTYFELYKGYANELSGRASTVISTSGLILMGEAAYNRWFEDLLGWNDFYLTKQRWGVSAKYFQSFTKFKVADFGNASIQVLNADLKYRFTPGLWTRDETQGAMISYQDTNIDLEITDFKVPMMGFGWFWARSMPKVFDDLFNYIPLMRYPKWVDMEFIYYAASMDSSKQLDFNFALNFHGQVLWKKNFFGEAGFGIKRYAFVDKTNPFQANLGYQLNVLYGTVGLGIKF